MFKNGKSTLNLGYSKNEYLNWTDETDGEIHSYPPIVTEMRNSHGVCMFCV